MHFPPSLLTIEIFVLHISTKAKDIKLKQFTLTITYYIHAANYHYSQMPSKHY